MSRSGPICDWRHARRIRSVTRSVLIFVGIALLGLPASWLGIPARADTGFAWVAHDSPTQPQTYWGTAYGGCPCNYSWGADANTNTAFSRVAWPNFGQVAGTGATLYGTLGPTEADSQALTNATTPSFAGTQWGTVLRWTDSAHWYAAYLDGTSLKIAKDVGGTISVLSTMPFVAAPTVNYTLRFQAIGTALSARAWQSGTSEPTVGLTSATDASLATGSGGVRVLAPSGTTVTFTTFTVLATPTPNAGNTQALLLDLDGTSYDWTQMTPHYGAIALNAWNYPWLPAIRAANPSIKVFEYKDLTSTRPNACAQSHNGQLNYELPTGVDYCWAMANHPEWFLHNASGGLLVENGYPNQYEMDYGNAAYQQQWATNVVQDLTSQGWDGVEMDNAFTTYNAYGVSPTYPNDQATQTAMQSMLATIGPQIKTVSKLEVANVGYDTKYPSIWAAWLPLLTGLMDEYTWSWSTSVDQSVPDWNTFENEVGACAAYHDLCWFRVGAYQVLPASLVNFAVASYLLHADGFSVIGVGDMLWSNYPELYTSLGAALGAAYINGNGNWQRDFQGGSVIVNLSTWTGTIA